MIVGVLTAVGPKPADASSSEGLGANSLTGQREALSRPLPAGEIKARPPHWAAGHCHYKAQAPISIRGNTLPP